MKILIANRGEIAVRIIRACRELGLTSIAIYSDADKNALHTRLADEAVFIGPAAASESYLNIDAVIQAAIHSGADAIHPGYGFLSENETFAARVEKESIIFIGPKPETIRLTGDKLAARHAAKEAKLPVLEGPDISMRNLDDIKHFASQINFPLLVKAVAGGGGRGIRLANSIKDLKQMIKAARQEAKAAFGNDAVYLEPFISSARHIEVQILGNGKGDILIFGERECSIQRRRQKLIEEAPAPGLDPETRKQIYAAATRLANHLNYRSLGTIEFLLDSDKNFYFIEVNPRIQVEHPVTEMVTGYDLVIAQLRLAVENKLHIKQKDIQMRGAAIEARVIAEDPVLNFIPTTGFVEYVNEPVGPGVRVDSALFQGLNITADYDSLIAKVIVWGEDRNIATNRLQRALGEFQIGGLPTAISFLTEIVKSDQFRSGKFDTSYLDSFEPKLDMAEIEKTLAIAAALLEHQKVKKTKKSHNSYRKSAWRMAAWREQMTGAF